MRGIVSVSMAKKLPQLFSSDWGFFMPSKYLKCFNSLHFAPLFYIVIISYLVDWLVLQKLSTWLLILLFQAATIIG
jgi:hypothetical protein